MSPAPEQRDIKAEGLDRINESLRPRILCCYGYRTNVIDLLQGSNDLRNASLRSLLELLLLYNNCNKDCVMDVCR